MDIKLLKKFFSKPKNIIWFIAIITIALAALLAWMIYTKDQPQFIPEETRENVRGGIKEAVAEPIKSASLSLGEAIENAAYESDVEEDLSDDDIGGIDNEEKDVTESWPTYTDPDSGISMRYPEGWKAVEGEASSFTITPDVEGYDFVGVDIEERGGGTVDDWWDEYTKDWSMPTRFVSHQVIGGLDVYHYVDESPLPNYFLIEVDGFYLIMTPVGAGTSYYEEIVSSIDT